MKEDQIVSAFEKINKDFGGVDILINNAGIGIPTAAKGVWCVYFTVVPINYTYTASLNISE